ncbi:hypothetical protein ACFP50_32610 [Streptomyces pratens]|uniref:Transcriptional regulator n=1 Tax=Streptomyces pratens TaxID=887456 RepID=A0ABW1M8D9_9ACTN
MLREAHQMLPTLSSRRAVLLALHRPVTAPAALDAAAKMAGPGRWPGDRIATTGRAPQ